MKKIFILMFLALPLMASAQTKVKETAVPRSVLLTLEKTYDSYKVKTWYQAPGQFIAELVIDGQNGRAYFTASGDWQYSAFPVKMDECPVMMTSYFNDNYLGYRVKSLDYIEEMSGDNYYRMTITKKGISDKDFEMVFDTRGKLMKSNAPDPDAVKREYYTQNNPDLKDENITSATKTERSRLRGRPAPKVDEPQVEQFTPCEAAVANFEKAIGIIREKGKMVAAKRADRETSEGLVLSRIEGNKAILVALGCETDFVARTEGFQALAEALADVAMKNFPADVEALKACKMADGETVEKEIEVFTGKTGEKLSIVYYGKVEAPYIYAYIHKFRGPDGKKPKPYTYVVVSQKVKGVKEPKFIRMEFDSKGTYTGLLAQPLDERDVQ